MFFFFRFVKLIKFFDFIFIHFNKNLRLFVLEFSKYCIPFSTISFHVFFIHNLFYKLFSIYFLVWCVSSLVCMNPRVSLLKTSVVAAATFAFCFRGGDANIQYLVLCMRACVCAKK